ncbi:hypothetical protein [Paenibacillus fonticola]|uniref:hypothetical protein n=1 Tax=Paenibacillus fonticola TaxID=379896 RepID=UPI00036DECE1|nr:hypothetical protein [Paenibacillus fonticola]
MDYLYSLVHEQIYGIDLAEEEAVGLMDRISGRSHGHLITQNLPSGLGQIGFTDRKMPISGDGEFYKALLFHRDENGVITGRIVVLSLGGWKIPPGIDGR